MHPTYNMLSMLLDVPPLRSHFSFWKSIDFLQSAINIKVIFSLNFHQHCFVFFNHLLMSCKWIQTFILSKLLVFSLTLCCVVFFACVCVSLCNVLFKFILVSICFYGVVMLLMLLQSFLCFEPLNVIVRIWQGAMKSLAKINFCCITIVSTTIAMDLTILQC